MRIISDQKYLEAKAEAAADQEAHMEATIQENLATLEDRAQLKVVRLVPAAEANQTIQVLILIRTS